MVFIITAIDTLTETKCQTVPFQTRKHKEGLRSTSTVSAQDFTQVVKGDSSSRQSSLWSLDK